MGEGRNATREHTRGSTHTCQPCEEAMGTYWIEERGEMGMAKYGGQSKSATRRIAWSDGEVWGTCLDQERGEMGMAAGERWAGAGVKGAC